jgi:hypothetical protein
MPYGPFKWCHFSPQELRWIMGLTLTLATQLFYALREWGRRVDWDVNDHELEEYSQSITLNHLPTKERVASFYEVAGVIYENVGKPKEGVVTITLEMVKTAVREVCQRHRYAF